MSNVLTGEAQKRARRYFKAHFILTGSLILIVGALLVFFAFTPAFLRLHQLKGSFLIDGQASTTVSALDVEQSRIEVLRAQALLEQFKTSSAYTRPTIAALEKALQARPSGVSIREIQYTVEVSGESTLILRGIASERVQINDYRNALSREDVFAEVSVPVGAFAEAEEGRFSITLTGTF